MTDDYSNPNCPIKIAHGTTKYALRQGLKQIVPAHIFNRRKLGCNSWKLDSQSDGQEGH